MTRITTPMRRGKADPQRDARKARHSLRRRWVGTGRVATNVQRDSVGPVLSSERSALRARAEVAPTWHEHSFRRSVEGSAAIETHSRSR
jgi:hypothetical protein